MNPESNLLTNIRKISKDVATVIVGTAVGSVVATTLKTNIPKTEKFKIAEMAGTVVGGAVATKLQPSTDVLVDRAIDVVHEEVLTRRARKIDLA